MTVFWIVLLCVIWVVGVIVALAMLLHLWGEEYGDRDTEGFVVTAVVLVAWVTGGITWGINGGLFDDTLPPDGCYRITTETVPMMSGKVVTVVSSRNFVVIPCF